jgi:hypothetical protein
MSEPEKTKKKRPAVVTILTWLLMLGAILNIIVGVAGLVSMTVNDADIQLEILIQGDESEQVLTDTGEDLVLSSWLLIVGVVQLVIAIGFWLQRSWAWVAAISWQALNLLVEIALALSGTLEAFALVVSIVLILLLNQSDVRRIFGITRQKNEPIPTKPLRTFDSN